MSIPQKKYPTIACCGLDCGLCPRYYTEGASRCPGCAGPGFSDKHPSCSFITCCVKKKKLEACGECPEFPCPKFKTGEEYRQVPLSSSYPPYRNLMPNQEFIRDHGISAFLIGQARRTGLLETMLRGFDEGRSRSAFCRAAALLDIDRLEKALEEASGTNAGDRKTRANLLKDILAGHLAAQDSQNP
jgi:hypothetical protein